MKITPSTNEWTGGVLFVSGEERVNRLASDLAVFARSARPTDRISDSLANDSNLQRLRSNPPIDAGTLRFDQSRLLLASRHSRGALYGIPTDNNWVCTFSPGIASTCSRGLINGISLRAMRLDRGGHVVVFGIVADEVADVWLVVAGRRYEAAIGENGLYLEISESKLALEDLVAIEVHSRSGRVSLLRLADGS